ELVAWWQTLHPKLPEVWSTVLSALLEGNPAWWQDREYASIRRFHNSALSKPVECEVIPAAWVRRFRGLECLPDTFGRLHHPCEISLRTPATEPLIGVEPFVRAELDTEASKPLLRLLGVRDTPAGVDSLLTRLGDIARVPVLDKVLGDAVGTFEAIDRVL